MKKPKLFVLFLILYIVYWLLLLDVTMFPIYSAEVGRVYWNSLIHLKPFSDGVNALDFANVIMFVPMGILVPFVFRKVKNLPGAFLAGLLGSLCIELLQLLIGSGILGVISLRVCDVDDLIFNSLGAVFGFLILLIAAKLWNRIKGEKIRNKMTYVFEVTERVRLF